MTKHEHADAVAAYWQSIGDVQTLADWTAITLESERFVSPMIANQLTAALNKVFGKARVFTVWKTPTIPQWRVVEVSNEWRSPFTRV